jgi:rhodanese-related sulfurtransferase
MSLPTITPQEARRLIADGAVLIDVREADEHSRERIPGSRNVPLSRLGELPKDTSGPVLFHCRSGHRTAANGEKLAKAAGCEAYVVSGGIEAWKAAGLPTAQSAKAPIEIMRQVQITAGAFTLIGLALGAYVDPVYYGIAAFMGAGLMFSGITGTCPMASLLKRMPWNRLPAA